MPLPVTGDVKQVMLWLQLTIYHCTILRSYPKATACGSSGLCVQNLIDALDATLITLTDMRLCKAMNQLITGKVPATLVPYLHVAGGN